ncbi:radical SAM protein [Helicobacter muridarum]|uniref:Radical SAM domain-containing protein n=1 Tax=Helicobacter muridarum TaxID=216 RepID=A0A099TZL7_9HELI|nr:radical SAM protein [Helicobacter muridarum]TLE00465.1 radical SAM protein [Helicobacter muridarum]STQ86439.1 radical SAM domain-containing protein [Helicobacter muridarum]
MDIVFGPVLSRRFGISLGVDLSPKGKQCNFNCVYCELQAQKTQDSQSDVASIQDILNAIEQALYKNCKIDVLTFTANGEPTLYPHLEELIIESKKILKPYVSIKTLILSNGSKFGECKNALKHFDIVKFSLDSISPAIFKRIDKPSKNLDINIIQHEIKDFARDYKGELVAEILIVKGINDDIESNVASANFLREINIKRLDISSIDRPSSHRVFPVSNAKLYEIAEVFSGLPVCVVTRGNDKMSLDRQYVNREEILKILARRPLSMLDCEILWTTQSMNILEMLLKEGTVIQKNLAGTMFYYINNE